MTLPTHGLLATAIALLLVACTPNGTLESTSPSAASSTPLEELQTARTLWEESGPSDYQFEIFGAGCECNLVGRFQIFVEDLRVTQVVSLDQYPPRFLNIQVGLTIDDIFRMIDEGLAVADEVEVTYDNELGYPSAFTIVWDRHSADGRFTAAIELLGSEP